MATIINSIGLKGLEGYRVQVEVQVLSGVEGITIVGLPDASVKESKERVLAALYSIDCPVPDKRVIINLSPAEQKKNSPFFDLAMAIGIMKETNAITDSILSDAAFLGVLSLNGSIKPVEGMAPAIIAAKKMGIKTLYMPLMHNIRLPHMDGLEIRYVETIQDIIDSFSGQIHSSFSTSTNTSESTESTPAYDKDFKHILGHKQAKRALEIAAAGGHNLLMIGPPGCGKSLLAETFPSILPPLTEEQAFEVMSIHQLAGMNRPNYKLPPFRSPHHSASAVSLIGGGTHPRPGEVSLAHNGVLFLDEMTEFPKRTLDMLRQPLETGKVTISRAATTVTYPSQFLLLGAMNPCPCGYIGSAFRYCTCTPKQILSYQNRLSGPIEDRMDILLKLDTVALDQESMEQNESSAEIRSRIHRARHIQSTRYGGDLLNAMIPNERLLPHCELTDEQQQMLRQWSSEYNWSSRVQMKILRVARTVSDLSGQEEITNEALWEAVTIRRTNIRQGKNGIAMES